VLSMRESQMLMIPSLIVSRSFRLRTTPVCLIRDHLRRLLADYHSLLRLDLHGHPFHGLRQRWYRLRAYRCRHCSWYREVFACRAVRSYGHHAEDREGWSFQPGSMVSFVRRIDPFLGNFTLNGSTLLQVHVITSSCLNIQRNRVGLSGLAEWPSDVPFLTYLLYLC
jgi:hypothetical protein